MHYSTLGRHLIVDIWVKDPAILNDPAALETIMVRASEAGRLIVIGVQMHQFSPHGVTGVVLLATSHMSIHTWPEHSYAALDIFTCDGDPWASLKVLEEGLDAEHLSVRQLERGVRELNVLSEPR